MLSQTMFPDSSECLYRKYYPDYPPKKKENHLMESRSFNQLGGEAPQ